MEKTTNKLISTGIFILIIFILRLLLPRLENFKAILMLKLKLIYRLNLKRINQEKYIWEDLVNLHIKENWNYTIHNNSMCLESIIPINENTFNRFFYMIYENKFISTVNLLHNFPEERTTEIFILAMHINNILNDGIITIDTEKNHVEYTKKEHILSSLLVPNQIRNQIVLHYEASVKIQSAFSELINNKEEPVIVFADFMRKLNENDNLV